MKHHPPHKPHWWPENEEWPPHRSPRHWRGTNMRANPFFRRIGCFFALLNLLGATLFFTAITYALNYFDIIHISLNLFSWLLIPLGIFFAFFLVLAMVFAAIRMRHMSMPLDELLTASQKVAHGDYSVRVEETKGWPESHALARGFNAMVDRLQVNEQGRRNMLADISHELRNPITVIQGNLEGMMDGLYPANVETLKSLYEETQILARLVDDLKTFSLAEAGALPLRRELIDLGQLIRDAVSAFTSKAGEKRIKLDLLIEEVSEIEVDPLRVREALVNLLTNALRHTPRDGVIRVRLTESASGEGRGVTIFVHDSGAGVESANLDHIFDRFYKSSDSGGMGLGLSIAKVLVEAHGGKIWAENDNGAKISFSLPR